MRKFLVYLVVILVAVSVGFTVFYLVKDNESISISTSSIYMREGDVVDDLDIVYKNKKSFSDYEVISSNEGIAKYDKKTGQLTAVSGGIATITFRTSNVNFRNLSCQVYVGDGSLTSPYYIQTAQEMREIGKVTGEGETATVKYGLDKCYKLVANIDLADGYSQTGYWIPIGTGDANGFTGNFDGNGYTVSNININREAYIEQIDQIENFVEEIPNSRTYNLAGLFGKVGVNGRVSNLKVDNFNAAGMADDMTIGAIAGENAGGTIERCEVLNANISGYGSYSVGGVVGYNQSVEKTYNYTNADGVTKSEYVRYTARIDRCIANVQIANAEEINDKVFSIYAGGITGVNNGGIIIYSYAKGEIFVSHFADSIGGIAGKNTFINFASTDENYLYPYIGAHIKDTYSLVKFTAKENYAADRMRIGGVIGRNIDRTTVDLTTNKLEGIDDPGTVNKIVGNYYHAENLNYAEEGKDATTFVGVGELTLDTTVSAYVDTKYVVEGKTDSELKLQGTYVSHEDKEHIKNLDTGEYDVIVTEIPWKFDTVWYINENLNNGFPTINFANIEVTDDLYNLSDGSTIDSVAELQSMKLDGNYIITADIKFGADDIWVPIGTVTRPFVGSLKAASYVKDGVQDYYKIYDLKTVSSADAEDLNREQYEHAGLFGVTSGSMGGKVEDIQLVNPLIINGKVVGGIVGSNGYSSKSGLAEQSFGGMNIINCSVVGGTLTATQKVGAIAGENYGTITTSKAVDYRDNNFNLIASVKVTLYGRSQGYAGGIVGYNGGLINACQIADNTAVVAETAGDLKFTVYVGGIAGANNSTISNCMVTTLNEVAINGLRGSIGGVVGINQANISNVLVEAAINAPVDSDQVYAGGIVGSAVSKSKIVNAFIKDSSVRGYNAGGLVGMVNYSGGQNNERYNLSVDKNYNYTLTGAEDTFSSCGVDGSVAVEGKNAGGLAAVIDNGIFRNCYTRATLRGIDSGSIKAGFAVELNLNPTTKAVGIIINCYNTCSFAKENGKNYSVTRKEILQDPLFDLGVDALKRDAGYCFNYAYVTQDGVTNPTNKDFLANLFKKDPAGTSVGSLQGSAPKHLTDRNFSQDYWTFHSGALPTLKGCDGLEGSLSNQINGIRKIEFPTNVIVKKNNVEIASGSEVKKGDVLTISYVETEKHTCVEFKVNGEDVANNTMYIVEDKNIEIIYRENLTHFDIAIEVVGEGTVTHQFGYALKETNTSFAIVPAEGYALLNIRVVGASGTEYTEFIADGFKMPSENVTATFTFAPTYTISVTAEDISAVRYQTFMWRVYTSNGIPVGALVKISPVLKDNYVADSIIVKDASGTEVAVTGFEFVMPESTVTIEVVYKKLGTVTVPANVVVTQNSEPVEAGAKVVEGATVALDITPATGYVVETITVTKAGGGTVEVTGNTFVMPDDDVTVEVTYVEE